MIITHFTDNDLYKFTTMCAVQKLYPNVVVRYQFFDRNGVGFPDGFAEVLRKEINDMALLSLTSEEEAYIRKRCYFFDPVFIDLLKGFRYDPSEVVVSQHGGQLTLSIEGYWYRTVLWEVPLLSIISELYFKMKGVEPVEVEERAKAKAIAFQKMEAKYSEFGSRRRFSFDVHDRVVKIFKDHSGDCFTGSSNVYMAMKHELVPIGTHPHEWFMFHGAKYGYRVANEKALDAWVDVYQGSLGTALTDTYTTDSFFHSFSLKNAKLFDGIRWDSGDPFSFTDNAVNFYQSRRIDPQSKTIVYSDALNLERVRQIKEYVNGRIHDVYGIGTYLTNDVGVRPLNIVIKLIEVKNTPDSPAVPAIKLSDTTTKYTGDEAEIVLCKQLLRIQ